jgi:protein-tyrosine phosphatase
MSRTLRNPPIDANLVAPRLYIGSRPPPGRYRWFNTVVLCAKEFQPPSYAYPGLTVMRIPLVDDHVHPLSDLDAALVTSNARSIARYLQAGSCVLVTCRMGINRSALVAAIAMQVAFEMPADEAIEQIRDTRSPQALSNPRFEQFVRRFERAH